MAKLPTQEDLDKARIHMDTYYLALGRVANDWNHMQEQLGLLFCAVAGLDNFKGMRIWHALKSDRSQRDLLEAATTAASADEGWQKLFPRAKEDIEWILERVNARSEGRNSAIHAPVLVTYGDDVGVIPMTFSGNPNAAKLATKDIMAELEWYQGYFNALMHFTQDIYFKLLKNPPPMPAGPAWPDRPDLPTVRQRSGRQDRSRQDAPK